MDPFSTVPIRIASRNSARRTNVKRSYTEGGHPEIVQGEGKVEYSATFAADLDSELGGRRQLSPLCCFLDENRE